MTTQIEFLECLANAAEDNCRLDSKISLNELSASNSLYAEVGDGFTETTYYDKSTVKTVPVLFLCRNKKQERCLEQLSDICDYFQQLKRYPQGKSFSWLDAAIAKEPSRIGRDEDGVYHYSCIINCKLFY